jgi:LPXTG-motif cell wall-anchored protein
VYTPEYLRFWKAIPPPSQVLTGELRWDNVLQGLGLARLHPNEAITITTVFTPVQALDGGNVNRAGAVGVRDEFQNQLAAPREAEVPIRILPAPSSATPRPRSRSDQATPTEVAPTPTLEITATAGLSATDQLSATAAPTPTSAALPARLPRTGGDASSTAWGLVGLALLAGGALGLLRLRRARRPG